MGPGYWVWLIRLASASISIGIVTDPHPAPLRADEPLRAGPGMAALNTSRSAPASLEEHRDKLQDFKVLRNYAYGVEQVYSADRWAPDRRGGVVPRPVLLTRIRHDRDRQRADRRPGHPRHWPARTSPGTRGHPQPDVPRLLGEGWFEDLHPPVPADGQCPGDASARSSWTPRSTGPSGRCSTTTTRSAVWSRTRRCCRTWAASRVRRAPFNGSSASGTPSTARSSPTRSPASTTPTS